MSRLVSLPSYAVVTMSSMGFLFIPAFLNFDLHLILYERFVDHFSLCYCALFSSTKIIILIEI